MSSKLKDFKKGINLDEGRRRREASAVAIRKDKKEENILKRRNISVTLDNSSNFDVSNEKSNESQLRNKLKKYSASDISNLLSGLQTSEPLVQLESIRGFRRMLSTETNTPFEECINAGVIPLFVEYLQRYDNNDLQFEAAWALTNVASSKFTSVVVECNAIPSLINLLSCPFAEIREQCAWCLGNIAGDNTSFRDLILNYQGLLPLLTNIMQPASISLLRNCTWTLSNFCRGRPQPNVSAISPALPIISQLILSNEDVETVIDTIWALSYISDGDNNRIQLIVDLGLTEKLVSFLASNNSKLIVPSLRVLGNIVSGNDKQTEEVIKANIFSSICSCLTNQKKNIRKESLWLLSNIAAGTKSQVERLLNASSLLPIIIDQMSEDNSWEVRKEATWTLCNCIMNCSYIYLPIIIKLNGLNQLMLLLDLSIEVKILFIVLDALEHILKLNNTHSFIFNVYDCFDCNNGIDRLETLQTHENEDVYKKSCHIIETYFNAENEEIENGNNENINTNSNTLSFGIDNNIVSKNVFSFTNNTSAIASNQFKF